MSFEVKTGITGNKYVYSKNYGEVRKVCIRIGKSVNSIYFNKKYSVWVARIKSKAHKRALEKIWDSAS